MQTSVQSSIPVFSSLPFVSLLIPIWTICWILLDLYRAIWYTQVLCELLAVSYLFWHNKWNFCLSRKPSVVAYTALSIVPTAKINFIFSKYENQHLFLHFQSIWSNDIIKCCKDPTISDKQHLKKIIIKLSNCNIIVHQNSQKLDRQNLINERPWLSVS